MRDLNFLKPFVYYKKLSFRQIWLASMSVFTILFFIFNFPEISSSAFNGSKDEEANLPELVSGEIIITPTSLLTTNTSLPNNPSIYPVDVSVNQNGDSLSIPKLNVYTPIVKGSSTESKKILQDLQHGVVLYPGSTAPGSVGTTIIVGHSSSNPPWTKYSNIFASLDKLVPNDLIYISSGEKKYNYRVRVTEKGSVQHIIDSGLAGDLILSSCWPVGTDLGRIVIVADLIK